MLLLIYTHIVNLFPRFEKQERFLQSLEECGGTVEIWILKSEGGGLTKDHRAEDSTTETELSAWPAGLKEL